MKRKEVIRKLLESKDFDDVKIGISLLGTVDWEELQEWFGKASTVNAPKVRYNCKFIGYMTYYWVNEEYVAFFSSDGIVFRNPKKGFFRSDYKIKEL